GHDVDVDENEHQMANNQAELEGRVSATNCPSTITVGTMTPITVNLQNARIRHGNTTLTCSQIHVNDRIEAKGTKNGATFVATEVKVETERGFEHDDDNEIEVKGTVSGAPAGHACPAFTFSVGSTTVTTTATTQFDDVTCAGVVNGISVEAEGTRTS